MQVYHRQAIENRIVDMAHRKDLAAKAILKEVFYGTPGTLVGVLVCDPRRRSVIFMARATHPNEPLPYFQNLNESQSLVVIGAAATLNFAMADCYVSPDEFGRIARTLPLATEHQQVQQKSALRISEKISELGTSRIIILPESGFVALNPDGIVAKLQRPNLSKEMYDLWKKR